MTKPMTSEQTEMELAATNGDCEKMKALLDGGASISFRQHLPLRRAIAFRKAEIVKLILSREKIDFGAKPINIAASSGDVEIFNMLIDAGGDPTQDKNVPISLAAEKGNFAIVRRILELGGDPTARGNIAYRRACAAGNIDLLEELLRFKNIDKFDFRTKRAKRSNEDIAKMEATWLLAKNRLNCATEKKRLFG